MATPKVLRPKSRGDFEIAIVCAKSLEYSAVCLLMDGFWDEHGDPFGRATGDLNTYTTGFMGWFNIVIVLLCDSGKVTAAGTAASLRSSYPCIKLLLLTGTCDGVPSVAGEELLLGDVVISDTVVQYDLGHRYSDGFREKDTLEDRLGRPDKNVRNLITVFKTDIGLQRLKEKVSFYLGKMQSRESMKRHQKRYGTTYQYPGSTNDVLFESTYCHKHYGSPQCICGDYTVLGDPICGKSGKTSCEQTGCDRSHLLPRMRIEHKKKLEDDGDVKSAQQPFVFIGRFGSGDTSFRTGIDRDQISQKHNIIAFETEGAGIWDELPCIIVKGVSTYGDGHKVSDTEAWENFAAATAACAVRGLISCYPQTDKPPFVESKNQMEIVLRSQADIACLRDLYITSPPNDKTRIQQTKGGLLLDAYVWILKNDAYKQWIEDPNTCLLWIRGDPGKGKTMLLCGIIDQLQESELSGNLYYFFCQATDSRLNNASSILRGLLHMLISKQPSLISYVRNEYDKSGRLIFEDANSWVVLSQIFLSILGDPSVKNLTFIIDALDECTAHLHNFLKLIRQSSSSSSRVKWLVSSRNEANIRDILLYTENQSTVSLELNAESVSASIKTYIDHKVELLSRKKRYEKDMRDSVREYLANNADGTFLWVALVCEMLEKAPSYDCSPKSARYPPGLDNLYENMMKKACHDELDWGRRILSINLVARRPLSIQELETLTFYPENVNITMESLENRWEEALGHCGNFLTQRKGVVYFIHQSAKDYILNKASHRLFFNGVEHINKSILRISISAMTSTLKRDIYDLSKPGFLIRDLDSQNLPSPDPLAPVSYCCVYWIEHWEKSISQSGDDESEELICTFLSEKYMHWLEALSLLQGMYQGRRGIHKLERLLVNTKRPGLRERVWDARRFIQMFGNAIADAPLQVYTSALLFSPVESITRKQFNAEAPCWVRTGQSDIIHWTSCVQRLDGEPEANYKSLSISSCGTWLAASNGQEVTIWDVETGRTLRRIDNNVPERSTGMRHMWFKFSLQHNNELAVLSDDEKLLIFWDVTTTKIVRQIKLPDAEIYDLSFIPSEPDIIGIAVGGHNDNTYVVYLNTQREQETRRRPLFLKGRVEYIVFSPTNNDILATCIHKNDGNEIIIENIHKGDIIQIKNFRRATGIAISPDGKYIAVNACYKKPGYFTKDSPPLCTLIDSTTGESIWMFGSYICPQGSPAFSADGQLLGIHTKDRIIIWNIASRQCIHDTKVEAFCLIFSSREKNQLFCGSRGTIDIIEVGQHEIISSLNTRQPPQQVVVSPNGRTVVSWQRKDLTIWKIVSGVHMFDILPLVSSRCHQVQFSPDSSRLIIKSLCTFAVWDITSQRAESVYSESTAVPWSFGRNSFSPNSQYLALRNACSWVRGERASYMILDLASGKRFALAAHVTTITFSSDSKQLAACGIIYVGESRSIKVEVWDIASISKTHAVVLFDAYFSDHMNSQINLYNYDYDARNLIFDPEKITFSDSNKLILSSERRWHEGRCRNFNIKVILTMKPTSDWTMETIDESLLDEEEPSCTLGLLGSWITLNAERVVLLPPECRPISDNSGRYWDVGNGSIAISNSFRSILILHFDCSACPGQVAANSGQRRKRTFSVSEGHERSSTLKPDYESFIMHLDMGLPDGEKEIHSYEG